MDTMKVRLTFFESVLGGQPKNKEVYRDYIASKAPDASTISEEIFALGDTGVDEVAEKKQTGFPYEDGKPFIYDYMIRGFFKSACSAMRQVEKTKSKELKAYKKRIDELIFVEPRHIFFENYGAVGACERPLRAQTPMGERTALASSDEIQAGASVVFEIRPLRGQADFPLIEEWLNYGRFNGIGQWRNGGHGRFTWEYVND